jgi:hypothetical protein
VTNRRLKDFRIDENRLADLLFARTGGWFRFEATGVPPDATCVGVRYDFNSMSFQIRMTHPTFPEVPVGEMVPVANGLDFRVHYRRDDPVAVNLTFSDEVCEDIRRAMSEGDTELTAVSPSGGWASYPQRTVDLQKQFAETFSVDFLSSVVSEDEQTPSPDGKSTTGLPDSPYGFPIKVERAVVDKSFAPPGKYITVGFPRVEFDRDAAVKFFADSESLHADRKSSAWGCPRPDTTDHPTEFAAITDAEWETMKNVTFRAPLTEGVADATASSGQPPDVTNTPREFVVNRIIDAVYEANDHVRMTGNGCVSALDVHQPETWAGIANLIRNPRFRSCRRDEWDRVIDEVTRDAPELRRELGLPDAGDGCDEPVVVTK